MRKQRSHPRHALGRSGAHNEALTHSVTAGVRRVELKPRSVVHSCFRESQHSLSRVRTLRGAWLPFARSCGSAPAPVAEFGLACGPAGPRTPRPHCPRIDSRARCSERAPPRRWAQRWRRKRLLSGSASTRASRPPIDVRQQRRPARPSFSLTGRRRGATAGRWRGFFALLAVAINLRPRDPVCVLVARLAPCPRCGAPTACLLAENGCRSPCAAAVTAAAPSSPPH
jgi:hypothetical protein